MKWLLLIKAVRTAECLMSAIVPDNCGNKWRLFLQVAVIKSAAVFKNNAPKFYYIQVIMCYTED